MGAQSLELVSARWNGSGLVTMEERVGMHYRSDVAKTFLSRK